MVVGAAAAPAPSQQMGGVGRQEKEASFRGQRAKDFGSKGEGGAGPRDLKEDRGASLEGDEATSDIQHETAPPYQGARSSLSSGTKKRTKDGMLSTVVLLQTTFVAALLVLGAAAAGLGYKKVVAGRKEPGDGGGPLLSAEGPEGYKNEVGLLVSQLEESWKGASQAVKETFAAQYVPRMRKQPPPADPLRLFKRRADELLTKAPGEDASEEEKQKYVMQLRVAAVVLKAASSRLASLKELEVFLAEKNMGGGKLALVRTPIPAIDVLLQQKDDLCSFPAFLATLDERRRGDISVAAAGGGIVSGQEIPRSLAEGLSNYLQAVDLQARNDEQIHSIFLELLETTGAVLPSGHQKELTALARKERLFGGSAIPFFPETYFSSLLAGFRRMRRAGSVPSDYVGTWGNDWTVKGARRRLRELETLVLYAASASVAAKMTAVERWAHAEPSRPPVYDDFGSLAIALL